MGIISKTIYLAGPIAHCTDAECNDWRDHVIDKLSHKYNFRNPMKRDKRDKKLTREECFQLVRDDLGDVDLSGILLANYWKHGTGTAMEIKHGFDNGKTVLVICNPAAGTCGPWITAHAHQVFKTVDEAILWLLEYNG